MGSADSLSDRRTYPSVVHRNVHDVFLVKRGTTIYPSLERRKKNAGTAYRQVIKRPRNLSPVFHQQLMGFHAPFTLFAFYSGTRLVSTALSLSVCIYTYVGDAQKRRTP